MHEDEVVATRAQVRRLVAAQLPHLAGLPLEPLDEFGTDHVLFRLGDELVVRMPRVEWALQQVDTDARWLPRLAPHLPVPVPEQVTIGRPGGGYPWRWSVVRWIPGAAAAPCSITATEVGRDLGDFVSALRAVDPTGAPVRADRGAALALRDDVVRGDLEALAALDERMDVGRLLAVWEDALAAGAWMGAPVWVHGDLKAGNLVLHRDRLAGVIDWGGPGVGDPALDLTAAWLSFQPPARAAFRRAAGLDDDAWRRGRGWALTISLRELPYYWDRSPTLADGARRALAAILEEFR